jgi:hypothetical protein
MPPSAAGRGQRPCYTGQCDGIWSFIYAKEKNWHIEQKTMGGRMELGRTRRSLLMNQQGCRRLLRADIFRNEGPRGKIRDATSAFSATRIRVVERLTRAAKMENRCGLIQK